MPQLNIRGRLFGRETSETAVYKGLCKHLRSNFRCKTPHWNILLRAINLPATRKISSTILRTCTPIHACIHTYIDLNWHFYCALIQRSIEFTSLTLVKTPNVSFPFLYVHTHYPCHINLHRYTSRTRENVIYFLLSIVHLSFEVWNMHSCTCIRTPIHTTLHLLEKKLTMMRYLNRRIKI